MADLGHYMSEMFAGFDNETRDACGSIDQSLRDILANTVQIGEELRKTREALDHERKYREFVERMLGHSVSSIFNSVVSGDAAEIYKVIAQLRRYHFGRFIQRDGSVTPDEFLHESVLLLEQNHKESRLDLGISCYDGYGISQDEARAVSLFRELCHDECPEASLWLGCCFLSGRGVAKNKAEAARLFKISAGQGNSRAQCYYGLCLRDGEGVEQSKSEAARYFKMSADQGDPNGQCYYGIC